MRPNREDARKSISGCPEINFRMPGNQFQDARKSISGCPEINFGLKAKTR
jgi:hypothetical protein